jgi:hypothetical protein
MVLLQGIKKQFDPLLDDLECQLVTPFHPRFRLMWLLVSYVKKEAMELQVEDCM